MGKFKTSMTADNSAVVKGRTGTLEKKSESEARKFLQNIESEMIDLETTIEDLTDFGPENTTSLRPGSADFNASKWFQDLHSAKMDLKLKAVELQTAQEIYDEWFGDDVIID